MTVIAIKPELLQRLDSAASQQGLTAEGLLEKLLHEARPVPEETDSPLAFLEYAKDAIIIISEDHTILRFNRGAEEIFGYQFAEVFGQTLDVLLPDGTATIHRQHVSGFAQSEIPAMQMARQRQVFGKRKSGEQFPVQVSISKFYSDGRLCFAAILRDMTEHVATIEELQRNAEVFRVVAENVTDMVCLHRSDGTFMYASPSSIRISGRTPEELVGTSPYDYFHPDDLEAISANHQKAMETGKPPGRVAYRHRHKAGHYVWLETLNNPILDNEGNINGLVTVSRDVTDEIRYRTELQNERDLLDSIIQTSPSAITVADSRGRVSFVNKRAERLLGMVRSTQGDLSYNAPEWKITDYDGNPFPEKLLPFVQIMESKQPVWDVRHAIEKPDGTRIYLAINGAPLLDDTDEVTRIVFTIEDYTSRQQAENDMANAIRRERELNQIQAAFISMVSHEFRTPMTVIMSSSSILQKRLEKLGLEDLNPRLKKIERQIKRLDSMITDATFINRSHVAGFTVQKERIFLPDFFDQLWEEVEVAYPMQTPPRIIVNEGSCTEIESDSNLLQHIFQNLFSNAIKYSSPHHAAVCRYHCEGQTLTVMVEDEGIGIPPEDHPRLFELFHRASNVGQISGTGLGLAIVK